MFVPGTPRPKQSVTVGQSRDLETDLTNVDFTAVTAGIKLDQLNIRFIQYLILVKLTKLPL